MITVVQMHVIVPLAHLAEHEGVALPRRRTAVRPDRGAGADPFASWQGPPRSVRYASMRSMSARSPWRAGSTSVSPSRRGARSSPRGVCRGSVTPFAPVDASQSPRPGMRHSGHTAILPPQGAVP